MYLGEDLHGGGVARPRRSSVCSVNSYSGWLSYEPALLFLLSFLLGVAGCCLFRHQAAGLTPLDIIFFVSC